MGRPCRLQTAWRRFCEQQEALGVDPYLPKVPEDDPRYQQVQAILGEYEAAVSEAPALSPDWERTSTDRRCLVTARAGELPAFQWNLIKGWVAVHGLRGLEVSVVKK